MKVDDEVILCGRTVCPGIAIGKPFFLDRRDFTVFEMRLPAHQMQREVERYLYAISRSKQDLKKLQRQLRIESASEGAVILEAQLEMLQDPLLTTHIEIEIRKTRKNADFVFQRALIKYQERFKAMEDDFFKERYQDLQDLSRRIFGYLNEVRSPSLEDLPHHSIVCAEEIAATDAASAHSFSVSAFITELSGSTSHSAIVAKAKGIPYVTHICLHELQQNAPHTIIVDGEEGRVILNPSAETIRRYEQLQQDIQNKCKILEEVTQWAPETFDGYRVRLSANVDLAHEIDLIHAMKAEGIGLFRSEYLFLPNCQIPSEERQCAEYRHLIERMEGLPVVIRTFDVGGDKSCAQLFLHSHGRSFVSGRSTRYFLKERCFFQAQLRAILRASVDADVSILFPMISTLSELKEAKAILEEAREQLQLFHPLRIGCMIEVPSAAVMVDHFAQECDFLSIGTNDLVQYAMALDRSESLAHEEPFDPSIIRLIKLITTAADRAEIPVSVCGEMASDPRFTALLIGLGVQELSVAPRFLPLIKNEIRNSSILEAVCLAERSLCLKSAQEIRTLLFKPTHSFSNVE